MDTKNLSRVEKEFAIQKVKAREIVSEIIRFGVSQAQILYIIRLLSLELEDMKLISEINDVIKQSERFVTESSEEINGCQKKTKIYT